MLNSKTVWQLKSGSDRRFRAGHPWVYSNELLASPKGVEPGELVELRDAGGKFLARGYGNPASLISFRTLSRTAEETSPASTDGVFQRLTRAQRLRESLGLKGVSHRLCFSEADQLPGLIADRYVLAKGQGQVIVLQAHTAGMNRLIPNVLEALERLEGTEAWKNTSVVLRNDVGMRTLDGLKEEEPQVLRQAGSVDLRNAAFLVPSALPGASEKDAPVFHADLIEGQKTGFFLDQWANLQLAVARILPEWKAQGKATVKILDLCCYVGHWGAQLARALTQAGLKVEVTAVDASEKALQYAKKNIEAQGAACKTLRADVLRDLGQLEDRSFDIVISDPPALIKGRKAIGPGTHAYLQLNTQVFRIVKEGGSVVSCSCSSLLEEEEFLKVLSKAAQRNQRLAQWIARGGQSPDHPVLTEFPEGRYLKAWIARVGDSQ